MTEVESKIADACDKMKGFEKKRAETGIKQIQNMEYTERREELKKQIKRKTWESFSE
ncbi:hypothetical protein LEP1GSC043_3922 [Leptospira weilii str. Ecochallenge]|uniref:Uncharacterized protein n=1 Tax=Leptospira weilii str. Ecochallenge TaxID=1049986 RepID=N1U5N6_9LEPT|nr:hypothetical protein LEP1GSC043_3922 [Leptospira weilii str. Ecochallenge]